MSRWTDHAGALKRAVSIFGRTTVWIDGAHARLPGRAETPVPLAPAGDIAAALRAVEALAPRPARAGLHAMRVVVGAPFARYFALPWQPLPKPDDWIAMARMQALQTGAGAEPWRYAVSDGAWGHGRLAAAMPEALCAGIARICKARRLQLLGIEPAYTFALQRHARRIRDGTIAVIALEPTEGGAALAQIGLRRGGGWSGFIALPVSGPLDDVLRDAFVLCATEPPERRYVIGPGDANRWVAEASQVEWLAAPWSAAA
jgi:hypothetical protein